MASKAIILLCLVTLAVCRSVNRPVYFTLEELHLEDIDDVSHITPSLLIKRASDAITFRDDDVEDANYQFSYTTDSHDREEKGFLVNNELTVIGAYAVRHPDGYTQMTMYVADKDGFRPQVQLRFSNLLKSAVG